MPFTPVPLGITQADLDDLIADANAIVAKIIAINTTAIALTSPERQKSVTVGVKREPFNDHFYENKINYPDLKPSQTRVTEPQAERHFFIHKGMANVAGVLYTAIEMVTDIQMNSEHYTYDYASEGRLAAKRGAENGKPGADTWFNALDERFPQTGPSGDSDTLNP